MIRDYSKNHINAFEAASDEEIDEAALLLAIFTDGDEVDLDSMKKRPEVFPKLKKFMEDHSVIKDANVRSVKVRRP